MKRRARGGGNTPWVLPGPGSGPQGAAWERGAGAAPPGAAPRRRCLGAAPETFKPGRNVPLQKAKEKLWCREPEEPLRPLC